MRLRDHSTSGRSDLETAQLSQRQIRSSTTTTPESIGAKFRMTANPNQKLSVVLEGDVGAKAVGVCVVFMHELLRDSFVEDMTARSDFTRDWSDDRLTADIRLLEYLQVKTRQRETAKYEM